MKSPMKTYHLGPPRSDSIHSRPASAFPSFAKISAPPKTLLVVDDDCEQLQAEIPSQEGYNVLQADSAAGAMRVAASIAAGLTRRMMPIHNAICMIC